MKKNIVDKVNDVFSSDYKLIICDYYFLKVKDILKNRNSVLDYGSGNAMIKEFCNVFTSDIVPNGFNNEKDLDFYIDKNSGVVNTFLLFDAVTILRNYILYYTLDNFLITINYLKTLLKSNGILLIGKHTVYDDFGDWNYDIEHWLDNNSQRIDKKYTTFWII